MHTPLNPAGSTVGSYVTLHKNSPHAMQQRSLLHEKEELIGLNRKSANGTKGLDRSEVMAGNDVSTGEGLYIYSRDVCLLNRLLSDRLEEDNTGTILQHNKYLMLVL